MPRKIQESTIQRKEESIRKYEEKLNEMKNELKNMKRKKAEMANAELLGFISRENLDVNSVLEAVKRAYENGEISKTESSEPATTEN